MCNEQQVNQAVTVESTPAMTYQYRCGYCGSTELPIPYEQMFGPGAIGWDCCPDCGGV
jgi:hypothetical protein